MQNNSILFKNIEVLGDKYIQKILFKFDKQKLECDWWEALKFFFWHSFMRGRRDELSGRYEKYAIDRINKYFNIASDVANGYSKVALNENRKYYKDADKIKKMSIKENTEFWELVDKNPIVKMLVDESKKSETENNENKKEISLALTNPGDIVMVLKVLDFITESESKKNIYLYMKNKLEKEGGVTNLYDELIGIKYIKDKIATFIIRDIILLNPQIKIYESDYERVFPIDTWVDKIAERLECKGATINQTKEMLIKKVKENKLDICKSAAGFWYLGSLSLNVLLDYFVSEFELPL